MSRVVKTVELLAHKLWGVERAESLRGSVNGSYAKLWFLNTRSESLGEYVQSSSVFKPLYSLEIARIDQSPLILFAKIPWFLRSAWVIWKTMHSWQL